MSSSSLFFSFKPKKTLLIFYMVLLSACSTQEKKRFATVGEEKIVPKEDGSVEVINTKTLDEHLRYERQQRRRAEEERDYWKEKSAELAEENDKLRVRLGMKAKNKRRMPLEFDEEGNVTKWSRPKDPSNIDDEIEKTSKP